MIKKQGKNLITNMGTYFLLQVVNLLVGLVLPRMYLKVYGSEINGVISTVNSFISYFSYLEAGIGLTLIHSLFKPLADNDDSKINKILSFSKKQYQKISIVYFLLVVGLSITFPMLSSTASMGSFEFSSLVFVIGLYGAVDFYTMARYRVLLTADRKEYVITLAMIVAQCVRFLLTWMFLQFDMSVVFVKTVPIITLLLRSIILRIYVAKKYKAVSFNESFENDIVNTSTRWDALILQISINTSTLLPVILVSQFLNYKVANVYAVYNMVITTVVLFVSSLSSGVSPMLGRIIASKGDIGQAYNLYEFIITLILTIVFSVCAVMILPFIDFYVKVVEDVNYIYPIYAVLFSLWGALYALRMPSTAIINAAALYRENRMNNILNLCLQVGLGIALTALFGIIGALISMIVATIQRNISMSVVINKHYIKGSFLNTVKRHIVIISIIVLSFVIGWELTYTTNVTLISWLWSGSTFGSP